MALECPTCGTALPSDHPAFDLQSLMAYAERRSWEFIANGGSFNLPNGKVAEVVSAKTTYDTGDIDVEAYFGKSNLPQGSVFETFVVVKIGDAYFKKTGTGDSYGDVAWDGDVTRVTPTTKTITEYR